MNTIKTIIVSTLFALSGHTSLAYAEGPPGSEVFVAQLKNNHVEHVFNISNRIGYDNQPFFSEQGVYFTAAFESNKKWQTEIMFFDFAESQTKRLTFTPVSEYSPTLMPNGKTLSAVVVEPDGAQKLWQYPLADMSKAQRLFNDLAPVGYHAWGKPGELISFILGQPHSLYLYSIAKQQKQLLAKDIGRTLHFDSSTQEYSFSQYHDGHLWVARITKENVIARDFALPNGVEYFTKLNSQQIAFAKKNQVYVWQSGMLDAQPWLDLSDFCTTDISRLAYQAKAQRLAFVCAE